MSKSKLIFLTGIFAMLCLTLLPQAQAATKGKPKAVQQVQKERLVLMPLRVGDELQSMRGAMESALVDGLQQKYTVMWGEEVEKKAQEVFRKENQKHDCNEERCMQGIAEAFQSELLATASITKQEGGYVVILTIQNIFDHVVVFTRPLQCKGCDSFAVVDKLKELGVAAAPVAATPVVTVAEAPQPKVNQNDPDAVLWAEVQKGNTADDYKVYIDTFPKGKYHPLAKARIKKLKDEAQALAEQHEQQAWDTAQQGSSEDSYALYLKGYPNGRFAGLAKVRMDKLKNDVAVREENEQWSKADNSNDRQAVESYLNNYPAGRYLAAASAKLQAIKEEDAKGPTMVRIPGKNYEMGKYHVTRGEFAKFVSETGYDTGNECWVWTGKWEKKTGYNWRNPGYSQDDNHPVACVNWDDVQAYTAWLSKKSGRQYRLPTEAEWEYACYGGSQTDYCGSNDINAVAWYNSNNTYPVGQKQANGYGLYDMSGNVLEWQQDWSDNSKQYRSVRGGAWDNGPQNVRASYRGISNPEYRENDIGFRLARTLP